MLKLILFLIIFSFTAEAKELINLERIKQIESSNNPLAYNKKTEARGLYQITPICLKDYNIFHKDKYTKNDLFKPQINEKIAKWYITKRIPQLLKHYRKEVNIKNILISYNCGIKCVLKGNIPKETQDYIKKYKKEGGRNE